MCGGWRGGELLLGLLDACWKWGCLCDGGGFKGAWSVLTPLLSTWPHRVQEHRPDGAPEQVGTAGRS